MEIRYSRASLKFLNKLEKKSVTRIREAIQKLTEKPPVGDIKLMKGYTDGRYRLRVGDWRVIYQYGQEKTLEILYILDIGNRGDIYK